jgi:hypothetical protein
VHPVLAFENKLGQPIRATELVLTVGDEHGIHKGLTAHPRHNHPGEYAFSYQFPHPGHYVLRVFPPSMDSSFEIPMDVR